MKKFLIPAMILVIAVGSIVYLGITASASSVPTEEPEQQEQIPQPDFKVDTTGSLIGGVNVNVNGHTGKRSFVSKDCYQDRFYYNYGELDSIEISVSGTISRAECATYATAVGGSYADFFKLSIKLPENTNRVAIQDDVFREYSTRYDASNFIEDYFVINQVRWLDGIGHYGVMDGAQKINCFRIAFYGDAAVSPLMQYFVYVTYNLTFVD